MIMNSDSIFLVSCHPSTTPRYTTAWQVSRLGLITLTVQTSKTLCMTRFHYNSRQKAGDKAPVHA